MARRTIQIEVYNGEATIQVREGDKSLGYHCWKEQYGIRGQPGDFDEKAALLLTSDPYEKEGIEEAINNICRSVNDILFAQED